MRDAIIRLQLYGGISRPFLLLNISVTFMHPFSIRTAIHKETPSFPPLGESCLNINLVKNVLKINDYLSVCPVQIRRVVVPMPWKVSDEVDGWERVGETR